MVRRVLWNTAIALASLRLAITTRALTRKTNQLKEKMRFGVIARKSKGAASAEQMVTEDLK